MSPSPNIQYCCCYNENVAKNNLVLLLKKKIARSSERTWIFLNTRNGIFYTPCSSPYTPLSFQTPTSSPTPALAPLSFQPNPPLSLISLSPGGAPPLHTKQWGINLLPSFWNTSHHINNGHHPTYHSFAEVKQEEGVGAAFEVWPPLVLYSGEHITWWPSSSKSL